MSSKYPPFPCIDINDYTQHGDYVKTIHLTSPQGMKASILTLGARLIDLRLPDNRPLSLSLTTLQQIEADQAYIGVAVGRTANRIKHGILPSSRAAHSHVELQKNEEDRNHTHGGKRAWDKRLFAVRHVSKSSVDLYMFSPDGDQGYPSSVEVCVRYELRDEGQLAISLITTNVGRHQTVTNMTVHPYFDLTGRAGRVRDSVLDYHVHAPSCHSVLQLDQFNVPTGEVLPVKDTPFDFRRQRPIHDTPHPFQGYDNYFVASNDSSLDAPMRSLVKITAPPGEYGPSVEMEVLSNQPGFQMYTANGFDATGDGRFERFGSIAIEPSGFIDAVNCSSFPTVVLEPYQTRRQLITYKFRFLDP